MQKGLEAVRVEEHVWKPVYEYLEFLYVSDFGMPCRWEGGHCYQLRTEIK